MSKNQIKVVNAARGRLISGVYSRDVLLPGENKREFEALHQRLKAEFRPAGESEEEQILTVASLYWRLRRLRLVEKLQIKGDWLAKKLQKLPQTGFAEIRKAWPDGTEPHPSDQGLAGLRRSMREASIKIATGRTDDIASARKDLESVGDIFENVLKPSLEMVRASKPGPTARMSDVFSFDQIERVARVEAALEARIEKALGRFFVIQEWKRIRDRQTPRTLSNAEVVK